MFDAEIYDAFMLDHAAGTLPPALQLAGDLHQVMSPEGAQAAAVWASVRSALAADADANPDSLLSSRLPEALEIARSDFSDITWKRGLSGAQYAKGKLRHEQFLRLFPGESTLGHGHSTLEATVVLTGRFEDGHGVYAPGDIVFGVPGVSHKPAAYGDEPCICFVGRKVRPIWRFT